MRHIKNYGAVKKRLVAYFEREIEAAKNRLKKMELQENIDRAQQYLDRWLPGEVAEWKRRLEDADKAGKLVELNIRVEWSRSRMYGSNPHAFAYLCYEDEKHGTNTAMGEGRATGCGYDKRSAAVYEALCFNHRKKDGYGAFVTSSAARASLDRFVIEHGEELWKEYAIDKTPMPHFNFAGKGMSTFTRLFKRIGCRFDDSVVKDYLIDYTETDKGADVYHIIRKDRI